LCDGGGSNGCRARFWKYNLYQEICKKYGISVRVCHYPTGASKWNPVEHRLFGPITNNWQERPLRSFEIILDCIRSTATNKGLRVEAVLNNKEYQKGIKVSDNQMKMINLIRHDELPLWNYSLMH
ncbi:MAG: ISAzo13 family transposase, partial [Pseudomonadota bacterium]